MAKEIYRGYEIDDRDGKWIVSLGTTELTTASSEIAALNYVDAEKRRALAATGNSRKAPRVCRAMSRQIATARGGSNRTRRNSFAP
jgi:hypothetical protein